MRCPTCDSPDPKRHPAMQFEGEVQVCPDPFHPITALTITDEQIRELLDDALYGEQRKLAADCYVALHGVQLKARPRQSLRYDKTCTAYREARARCAEILNARSSK